MTQPEPDVYLPGILLQLEPCERLSLFEKDYPYLYTENGMPVVGPRGNHLRDVPGLPLYLPMETPASQLLCWSRTGCRKDLIDRWPTKVGGLSIDQIVEEFRAKHPLPLLPWTDRTDNVTYIELFKFNKLSPLQREHNTCGLPITPGFAIQQRPPRYVGFWFPSPQPLVTDDFPHKPGFRMAHRRKILCELMKNPEMLKAWINKQDMTGEIDHKKDITWFEDSELQAEKREKYRNLRNSSVAACPPTEPGAVPQCEEDISAINVNTIGSTAHD